MKTFILAILATDVYFLKILDGIMLTANGIGLPTRYLELLLFLQKNKIYVDRKLALNSKWNLLFI